MQNSIPGQWKLRVVKDILIHEGFQKCHHVYTHSLETTERLCPTKTREWTQKKEVKGIRKQGIQHRNKT